MRQPPHRRPGADPLALDDHTVERLLSGTLGAADAPPGYARVAELLAAAVAPPTPRELAPQAAVLAELRAVTRARSAATARRAGPPRRRRRFGLAAVVVAGALATGGVAAAATGNLPEPVRQVARSILTVGGDGGPATTALPAPVSGARGAGGTGQGATPSTGATGRGPGPSAAGSAAQPDLEGLCQAYLAGEGGQQGSKGDATAFQALSRAAGGDGQRLAFCQALQRAGEQQKKASKHPKDQQDPPGQGQGQGGPPATTGGAQGQGGPPPDPGGNDGTGKSR